LADLDIVSLYLDATALRVRNAGKVASLPRAHAENATVMGPEGSLPFFHMIQDTTLAETGSRMVQTRARGRRVARAIAEAVLAAALAAACGTALTDMNFAIPPDKTAAQLEQDLYKCLQRHENYQKFQACLHTHGYKLVMFRPRRFVPVPQF